MTETRAMEAGAPAAATMVAGAPAAGAPAAGVPATLRPRIDLAHVPNEGIDLHAVLALDDETIGKVDLAEVRAIIEEWYEPISDRAFQVFASAIKRRGWGRRKLLDATYAFLERRFPRWTPGEFFGMEPRLYPVGWYHARLRENAENGKRIGWYQVPGCDQPLCGWSAEIGTALPRWTFAKTVPAPAAVRETEPFGRAFPLDLELLKKLCLRERRVDDLEEDVTRLERELGRAYETIDAQSQALAELRGMLTAMRRSYGMFTEEYDGRASAAGGVADAVQPDVTQLDAAQPDMAQSDDAWPLPIDIDAAEGPNARTFDRLFGGVRGRSVGIYRISMSRAFYRALTQAAKPCAEHPQYVYGILYEVIADQQEDFLLWDIAGGPLAGMGGNAG